MNVVLNIVRVHIRYLIFVCYAYPSRHATPFLWSQANEKSGGYINKLVVTSLKNGQNRPFRVLQKAERAPIRALRASSSGRLDQYLYFCSSLHPSLRIFHKYFLPFYGKLSVMLELIVTKFGCRTTH